MKGHRVIGEGRGDAGFHFGRTFLIVIAIHAVFGVGLLLLARTDTGKQLAKQYNIKLFEPPKPAEPEEPPQTAETPPPPPPVELESPRVAAPQVAMTAPSAAPPQIGGGAIGGGGNGWSGGRFVGGFADGPEGAYHAGVTRLFREYYREPETEFGSAELELRVTGAGQVQSFRLARSSGDPANDQALLEAARQVQTRGTPPPPERKARVVTVRFRPY